MRSSFALFLMFVQSLAFAGDTECIKFSHLIGGLSKVSQKTIVLTQKASMAYSVDECTKAFKYPPKQLVETEVNGWWVLHDSAEDIQIISNLFAENIAIVNSSLQDQEAPKIPVGNSGIRPSGQFLILQKKAVD